MHAFATLAVLLSFGASSVLSGHVLAPARPAPQAFQQRQTSREQVVRRMTHSMRRVNKRQSQPSGTANRCGAPSSFMIQFSGSNRDSDNSYAVLDAYGTDGETFSVSTTTSAGSEGLGFLADVSSSTAAAIFFDTPGNVRDAGYITPTCQVSGGILSCSFQGATEFALCPEEGSRRQPTHELLPCDIECRQKLKDFRTGFLEVWIWNHSHTFPLDVDDQNCWTQSHDSNKETQQEEL
ncbi:hypothetical protein P389DRAFT_177928 [Cystobasidium minutum MCA 4210]|uniref:uncharacterized protein n=1 Tax=Cystobasidium minutum MCA 4210 TaxID=1397322 RepID=UPI0034CEACE3|eukprot:jgi/Rhomi1/177928/fgenesh1_pg.2_\